MGLYAGKGDYKDRLRSRFRGCLLGLAVGDALGAPVEFMRLSEIRARFGPDGIADFASWDGHPPGSYTDDTQMSLATAEGYLTAYRRGSERGIWHPPSMVYHAYLQWLQTQSQPGEARYPGKTCLAALATGRMGTLDEPINGSKGCGGVMRVAPAGLVFPPGAAFQMGTEFAAITHGHPSGYLSAGFLAEMVAWLIRGESLRDAMNRAIGGLVARPTYKAPAPATLQGEKRAPVTLSGAHSEMLAKVQQVERLLEEGVGTDEAIKQLGEGWVGEEALAIALYCALRYPDDWRAAVLAAVNHSGDSDSTGSICGAILGASLGVEAIPAEWVAKVENSTRLEQLADRLYQTIGNDSVPNVVSMSVLGA